ncbi:MAG: guanitoxin biosynthesis heme-dependent pre-guanitoxin N-hydroxylase GntA [Dokdonella sp.]
MILDPSIKLLRTPESPRNSEVVRAFKAFIRRKSYPCLGAKSALSRRALQCFCADDIAGDADDQRVTERVQLFASAAQEDDVFLSLVVLFPGSQRMTEIAFEQVLWQRLRAIHAIDQLHHGWDRRVSDDPASAHFSMSIGGRGFFVIGLHPDASRLARRFQCPVLVFNLHSQFEQLRADGRYDKLRSSIVERDIAFSGSSNPMLSTHGERSEARQYSGRIVDEKWVCPFASLQEESSK